MGKVEETRDGVALTNLSQPLFDGAGATKRDLVNYLDVVRDRILPHLRERPLSVMRVRPGRPPFMQKNLPKYTPDWIPRTRVWAAASRREISYARCGDRPDLATTAFIREDRSGKVFIDSTRAGGATVVSAYSPRLRPGVPVSFPVPWDLLPSVTPADFTIQTAPALVAAADPWADGMPPAQRLPADLIAEGRTIPVARVQAMQEGKRRARARRAAG